MQVTGYHGTETEIEGPIEMSERGSFGPGIYFTTNAEQAKAYGEQVYCATINLENPWIVNAEYDSDLCYALDFDSPSVDAVMSLPSGASLIEKAKAGDGLYGYELMQALKNEGYDGIVATYHDGCQEVVAFSADNVTKVERFASDLKQLTI